MGPRRRARELAVQALYESEITGEQFPERFVQHFDAGGAVNAFCLRIIHGVSERRAEIDDLIRDLCDNWRSERLSKVDLNIMRLATWEMLATETPASIVINEAIEIAKRFGTTESAAFVNGVLDAIAARLGAKKERPGTTDEHR